MSNPDLPWCIVVDADSINLTAIDVIEHYTDKNTFKGIQDYYVVVIARKQELLDDYHFRRDEVFVKEKDDKGSYKNFKTYIFDQYISTRYNVRLIIDKQPMWRNKDLNFLTPGGL